MQECDDRQVARFHRVVFLRGGRQEHLTFPGYVLAFNFLGTLHSSRKGRIEPVPELETVVIEPPAPDRPAGTIVLCPRGPRLRTWRPRRPRVMKRFPDFSKNVMNLPRQSAGFSLTFPEQPATTIEVIARHESLSEAAEWATHRYGDWADGEWWPKDEESVEE